MAQNITPLPPSPQRTTPDTFNTEADTYVTALVQFTNEANALVDEANAEAQQIQQDANLAAINASTASITVGVIAWVSGTTYSEGNVRYSPIDFQSYRRKTNGAGTTDPSSDSTNWALISSNTAVGASFDSVTITNGATVEGTLTATGAATFDGTISTDSCVIEKSAVISAANIDLSLANVFTKTITANTNFTITNAPASGNVASFILDITNGGAYAVTWFSNIKWTSGATPSLSSSGRDVLGFFSYDAGLTWNGFLLAKNMS